MNKPESTKASGPSRTRGIRQIRAEDSHLNRKVLLPAERFIYNETISGALLLVCAIVALVWANSAWSQAYFALWELPVAFKVGSFSLALDLKHWINDGLMAVLFFVIALEIKRELIHGDLSNTRKAALPIAAALGGMIFPAGIYLILPLFALVNAGVAFSGEFARQALSSAVTWGVLLGLIVGKVTGVVSFGWLAVRLGWAALPSGVGWRHIIGAGLIGGVGFTVSLFITELAFTDPVLVEEAKVGVLAASFIAAVSGYLFLLVVSRDPKQSEQDSVSG
ncbi:MAG: Na+/H+ antiporter NhaA [Lentimonas sp.]